MAANFTANFVDASPAEGRRGPQAYSYLASTCTTVGLVGLEVISARVLVKLAAAALLVLLPAAAGAGVVASDLGDTRANLRK